MKFRRFPIFFAAEGGGESTPAPTPAVAAGDSPTGSAVLETPRQPQAPPEIIAGEPAKEPAKAKPIRQAGVRTGKIDVAKELGLTASPSELVNEEAKRIRDENGKFVKKTPELFQKKDAEKTTPKLGEPAPKAADVKPEAKTPESKTPPPPTATLATSDTPAKIKIGEEEKTAEEWAAYHKELQEKAIKKPEESPTPAAEPAKKPEEIEAEQKKARDDWFENRAKEYAPDQKEFDRIISEGDSAAFGKFFAKVEENMRTWTAQVLRPHLEKLHGFDGMVNPILEREKLVEAYRRESDFLNANPDIKQHGDTAIQALRRMSGELHTEREDIQALLAATPNTPNAARYSARIDALSGDKFLTTLAEELKSELGSAPAPVVPTTPTVVPPAAPVAKPRPPAPGGQTTTLQAPVKKTSASSEIADLMANGY